MDVQIGYRPAQALAKVVLAQGEACVAESGAMVGMTTNVRIDTRAGGLMQGIKRLFGGESIFVNRFTAEGGPAEVLVAHKLLGDLVALEIDAQGLTLEAGAFVASSANVNVQTRVGGLRTLLGGEGLTVLEARAEGRGTLVLGAFGGIEEMTVDGEFIVDTGHLVAWDAGLEFNVQKSASGWLATWLSGEGLVCRFRGHGRVWVQSRSPVEYGRAMGEMLPSRKG
ncbi:MAG: TIGR00266 family protein [Polyangiales bacterium]|nr:TIGR00266 family protein [Myxococcales bacterium]